MIFPRRRFLHFAGWGAALAVLPAIAKNASAAPFPMRIRDLVINLDRQAITLNECVYLTKRDFKLLKLLWSHKGKALSREIILDHLYGSEDGPELKIIDVFIARLRFKIFQATEGRGSIKIDAVAGRGYVLIET